MVGARTTCSGNECQDIHGARSKIAGVKTLETGETAVLDRDIIHSVTNPKRQLTGAIHVYTGDFLAAERSEWDPATLVEQPFDAESAVRLFDEANWKCTD